MDTKCPKWFDDIRCQLHLKMLHEEAAQQRQETLLLIALASVVIVGLFLAGPLVVRVSNRLRCGMTALGERFKQKWPEWLIVVPSAIFTASAIHFDLADWVDQIFLEGPGKWLLILFGSGGILGYLAYKKIIGALTNLDRKLTAFMKRDE